MTGSTTASTKKEPNSRFVVVLKIMGILVATSLAITFVGSNIWKMFF